VPRLCEFYPGIYLTIDEKARKNLSQGSRRVLVYILPKPTHYKTYTHTHTHTHYKTHIYTLTHTLQDNIKPPQHKLKQTQYKIYPNEVVTIQSSTLSIS